jgi:hypothetical protein
MAGGAGWEPDLPWEWRIVSETHMVAVAVAAAAAGRCLRGDRAGPLGWC